MLEEKVEIVEVDRVGESFDYELVCDFCKKSTTRYIKLKSSSELICKTCLTRMTEMIDKSILESINR